MMSNAEIQRGNQSRSVRAWLLVLLLTWSQVSLAAHQFEHDATDLGEPCVLCTSLERNDDVLSGASDCEVHATGPATLNIETVQFAYAPDVVAHYRSRASP